MGSGAVESSWARFLKARDSLRLAHDSTVKAPLTHGHTRNVPNVTVCASEVSLNSRPQDQLVTNHLTFLARTVRRVLHAGRFGDGQ